MYTNNILRTCLLLKKNIYINICTQPYSFFGTQMAEPAAKRVCTSENSAADRTSSYSYAMYFKAAVIPAGVSFKIKTSEFHAVCAAMGAAVPGWEFAPLRRAEGGFMIVRNPEFVSDEPRENPNPSPWPTSYRRMALRFSGPHPNRLKYKRIDHCALEVNNDTEIADWKPGDPDAEEMFAFDYNCEPLKIDVPLRMEIEGNECAPPTPAELRAMLAAMCATFGWTPVPLRKKDTTALDKSMREWRKHNKCNE